MADEEEIKAAQAQLEESEQEEDTADEQIQVAERKKALNLEKAKFVANSWDRASTAVFAVGVLPVTVEMLTTRSVDPLLKGWNLPGGVLFCIAIGFVLHWIARAALTNGFAR